MSVVPERRTASRYWLEWTWVLLIPAAGWACAAPNRVTRLGDGTLRAECELPLSDCLERVAEVNDCARHGYDVLQAQERRKQTGTADRPSSSVTSEVVVRCRQPVPPFGADPNPPSPTVLGATSASCPPPPEPPPPAPPSAASPTPRVPACVPGASVACTSTVGCAGAQVCAPDGASFGPCQCAAAEPPPPPETDADSP